MMSILDEYFIELQSSLSEINRKIGSLKNKETSCTVSEVETLLGSYSELLQQSEMEIRSNDAATRRTMTEKLKPYKDAKTTMKSDLDGIKFGVNKSSLTGQSGAESRQKMESQNERIERQNEILRNACRTLGETEELAQNELLPGLRDNREKIVSAQEKTTEISGIIDSAQKKADSMTRRHKTWGFF